MDQLTELPSALARRCCPISHQHEATRGRALDAEQEHSEGSPLPGHRLTGVARGDSSEVM